jgi:hypothetical protein
MIKLRKTLSSDVPAPAENSLVLFLNENGIFTTKDETNTPRPIAEIAVENDLNTNDPTKPASVQALNTALEAKADLAHNHTIAEIYNLQDQLDQKVDQIHTHAMEEVIDLKNSFESVDFTLLFNNALV